LLHLPSRGRGELAKTAADILAAYPYLEPDDISAALAYAAWRAEEVEVPLPQ
jgi:uncharacterized protein (DUF433 family)